MITFFTRRLAWLQQNIYGITFNEATDDIVVSAMSVDTNGHILTRFPQTCPPHAPSYLASLL